MKRVRTQESDTVGVVLLEALAQRFIRFGENGLGRRPGERVGRGVIWLQLLLNHL